MAILERNANIMEQAQEKNKQFTEIASNINKVIAFFIDISIFSYILGCQYRYLYRLKSFLK